MNKFGIVTLCLALYALTLVNGQSYEEQDQDFMLHRDAMEDRALSAAFIETIELNTTGTAVVKTYIFINNQKMSWMEAAYFCSIYDYDLLTIEKKLEHDVIVKYISESGNNLVQYWLSGNKIGRSGFLWLNNAFMTFSRWAAGEPNVPSVNCMVLYNGAWYDAPCEGNFVFICESK